MPTHTMPTDEQRAFWAAIRANPNDDTPRLVYADWLQENGDGARAEFIRAQVELANLGQDRRKGRKRRLPLETTEANLLAEHRDEWLSPFRACLKGSNPWDRENQWLEQIAFRRGFIDAMYFGLESARCLAASADVLEPVDRVGVSECAARYDHASVVAITEWPGAGAVLYFSIAGASDKDLYALTRTNSMRNVSHLGMWHGTVSDDGVKKLAAWPFGVGLRSIDLKDNAISDAGAHALAESPYLLNLTRLDLYRIRMSTKGRSTLRARFGDALAVEAEP